MSLLGNSMNIHVWRRELRRSLPNLPYNLGRRTVETRARELNDLRNRIAHHEPIFHQPLADRYSEIIEITCWVSVEMAWWVDRTSDVPETFRQDPR